MLVGVFLVQAVFLAFSFKACSDISKRTGATSITAACPNLADKTENLFGVAVATTLSLLTGQAVENFRNKN